MAETTKDSQVSLRVPTELKARMEAYSQLTGRSKSFVAMEALAEYLDWRLPQMQDLEQAIEAADRGEFASDANAAAVFARYGVTAAKAPAEAKAAPKRRPGTAAARAAKPRRA
jgi:predicted transcriptional regulator